MHRTVRHLLLKPSRTYSVLRHIRSVQTLQSNFVPPYNPANRDDIDKLETFVNESEKILVITGAGISTESGIPDYRSEGVGLYARSSNRPVKYQDFVKRADIRQRYWARNFVGWPVFSSVIPNRTHHILSSWEQIGKINWLVTQNVDALHYKAGSKKLTELHGSAHRVECMSCHHRLWRTELQEIIKSQNPNWHSRSVEMAPDGDVQLSEQQIKGFNVPNCDKCGGVLKPQIVFFGDNVPRRTVDLVYGKLKECDKVLVLGSSLEVYSSFRFLRAAHEQEKGICIINIGPTRADNLATMKISAKCSEILESIEVKC